MIDLQSADEFYDLIQETPLVAVQFGAESCAPCGAIRQKLDRWLEGRKNAAGLYVSIKDWPELSARLSVFSVPTVFLYAEGRLTLRESGYFSLDDMLRRAERYAELLADRS